MIPRFLFLLAFAWCACGQPADPGANGVRGLSVDPEGERWIRRTLESMTIEQRIAQLFAVRAAGRFESRDDRGWLRLVSAVRDLEVGGVVFFDGTPLDQAILVNDLQDAARVPLLVSQDMEWGAGMRVEGASRYPVAMALAATGDTNLAYHAGLATALEARAVGVAQVLAPVADVNTNPRNPVIGTRAFSDRPDVTARFAANFVRGVQEGGVMATVKHFPGHGGSGVDSHERLPVDASDAARLDTVNLVPFRAAIRAGVASVMTGHVAFPSMDGTAVVPASLSRAVSTAMLRDSLGFDGLVVTDALEMAAVAGVGTPGEIAVRAIEAGADMLLLSTDPWAAHRDVLAAVRSGRIRPGRIESSVRRILRAKAATRLHLPGPEPPDRLRDALKGGAQRALEETIAERALTLLRGSVPIVPDRPGERVLLVLVSDREDRAREAVFARALVRALPDAAVDVLRVAPGTPRPVWDAAVRAAGRYQSVVIAAYLGAAAWWQPTGIRTAFAQTVGGIASSRRRTALVVFGTPYAVGALPVSPDAVLLAWDASPAMQTAAAQAVAGRVDLSGRLPIDIPDAYPFGAGVSVRAPFPREAVAEAVGMSTGAVSLVDSVLASALSDRAFPGVALVIGRGDAIVHRAGYGHYTYESDRQITPGAVFDLASLTKVVATTTALMLLVDRGLVGLDDPVIRHVPEFGRKGKDRVTVRHLLSHTGGLVPYRPFHRMGITTRGEVLEAIFDEELEYEPGTEARYSDFGPIVLALVVERITGRPFDRFVREEVFEPLGMWHTGFRPTRRADPAVVPTERDHTFRRRLLQGEVHDETAWILGGVAGHAGLFSTADDLARFARMMVLGGRSGDRQFIRPETIRLFTSPVDSTGGHTRALGWDTRPPDGPSSAGSRFGPRSFGHTGYTGTSLWIDPDAGLWVILLTNRVYPTRDNQRHVPVRPAVADVAHGAIRGPATEPLFPEP